jgi:hypothetical protein
MVTPEPMSDRSFSGVRVSKRKGVLEGEERRCTSGSPTAGGIEVVENSDGCRLRLERDVQGAVCMITGTMINARINGY